MICRVCNSNIPDDAAFCTICGAPVSEPQASENTYAGQNTTQDNATQGSYTYESNNSAPTGNCPVCGAPYAPGAYACTNCGTILGSNGGYATQNYGVNNYPKPKSKVAAVLFALFFGALGIHNFYLGYTNKAITQLILGILCCGTVSGIWAFIEAIMILTDSISTDANGVPLQ